MSATEPEKRASTFASLSSFLGGRRSSGQGSGAKSAAADENEAPPAPAAVQEQSEPAQSEPVPVAGPPNVQASSDEDTIADTRRPETVDSAPTDESAPRESTPEDESTPLARELASENRRRAVLDGKDVRRPSQTRYLTVSNQKGGVGKTTTAVNIAAALATAGLNVLVVDIDPQGNASTALGVPHSADVDSVYDVLVDDMELKDVVVPSADVENLLCAPATIHLAGAEIELVSLVAREQRLRRALAGYEEYRQKEGLERLDYIIIDCPPSLGLLTVNAFVAAHEVLIPIQCEYYALEGLSQLLNNISLIQKHLNADLKVSTILLTMYDGRTNLAAQVAAEVREHFPDEVLDAVIPRSVRISEAPSYQQTVITYDRSSSGALSYLEAATEINERSS